MTEAQMKTRICHRTLSADKPGQLCIGTACMACDDFVVYKENKNRDIVRNPDELTHIAEHHHYCAALFSR